MNATIKLNSSIDATVREIQAELPDLAKNEHGEVYATPHGWAIRITDAPADLRAKLPRATVLDNGRASDTPKGASVRFGKLQILIAGRPWLAELADNWCALYAAQGEARRVYWESERQAEAAKKRARADALEAGLPADWRVGVFAGYESIPGTDGYGYPIYELADGRRIKIENGVETRTVSDEQQGWHAQYIGIHDPDAAIERAQKRAEEKARREAEQAEITSERERARNAELLAVNVPEDVVRAYNACGGNPERLEDGIDNPLYWLIKRYSDAIERQRLA